MILTLLIVNVVKLLKAAAYAGLVYGHGPSRLEDEHRHRLILVCHVVLLWTVLVEWFLLH